MTYHSRDVFYEIVLNTNQHGHRHSMAIQDICFAELLQFRMDDRDAARKHLIEKYGISEIVYHLRWHDTMNTDKEIRQWWSGLTIIFPELAGQFQKSIHIPANLHGGYILFMLRTLRMLEEQAEAITSFMALKERGYDPYFSLLLCQQFIENDNKVYEQPYWAWDAHWVLTYPCINTKTYESLQSMMKRKYSEEHRLSHVHFCSEDVNFALGLGNKSKNFLDTDLFGQDDEELDANEFWSRVKTMYQQLKETKTDAPQSKHSCVG